MEDLDENKSARVNVKKKQKPQNKATFVKGLLRRGSFHWRARTEAMQAARVARGQYRCAMCQDLFKAKEVDLDHIEPVVDPKTGFTTWDDYIDRLYCPAEGFQVICHVCHSHKTSLEDAMRMHYKTKDEKAPDLTKDKRHTKKKKKD